jgi:hypothetical protein
VSDREVSLYGRTYYWTRVDGALTLRPGPSPHGDGTPQTPGAWTTSPCAEWNAVQRLQIAASRGVRLTEGMVSRG